MRVINSTQKIEYLFTHCVLYLGNLFFFWSSKLPQELQNASLSSFVLTVMYRGKVPSQIHFLGHFHFYCDVQRGKVHQKRERFFG